MLKEKNLSGKYSKKRLDSIKISSIDAIKTISKVSIQKTDEATADLIGNKIDDQIRKAYKIKSLNTAQGESENLEFDEQIS